MYKFITIPLLIFLSVSNVSAAGEKLNPRNSFINIAHKKFSVAREKLEDTCKNWDDAKKVWEDAKKELVVAAKELKGAEKEWKGAKKEWKGAREQYNLQTASRYCAAAGAPQAVEILIQRFLLSRGSAPAAVAAPQETL